MKMHHIPEFLTKKSEIYKFLIFVAFFALIFIVIYKPFGSMRWINNLQFDTYFFYTSVLVLVGFGVLYFSRMLLFHVQKKRELTINQYIIWLVAEIFIISFGCAIVGYSISTDESRIFLQILPRVFLYTLSILFIPYVVSWLYFSLKEKERALKRLTDNNPQLGELPETNDLIKFLDKKGNLCFSVKKDDLLYFESFSNYVYLYYNNKGEVGRFVLRNTITNIEKDYAQFRLARCHRSFLVNIDKVKVVRKEKDGYKLELDIKNSPVLAISKSYLNQFVQLI